MHFYWCAFCYLTKLTKFSTAGFPLQDVMKLVRLIGYEDFVKRDSITLYWFNLI